VFALGVPNDPTKNPQPEIDLTVGRNPVIGNAPPSDGTGVSVSVTPSVQTVRQAVRAIRHRLQLEGSLLDRADGPGRAAGRPHFHTASARAAAFPGLQPEIDSFAGHPLPTPWAGPPGGP
jgi:hypothetical protein